MTTRTKNREIRTAVWGYGYLRLEKQLGGGSMSKAKATESPEINHVHVKGGDEICGTKIKFLIKGSLTRGRLRCRK